MTVSPREFVHAWFQQIWNEGDDKAIDRLMAPEAMFHGLPSPDGRPIVGPAEFKPFFEDFRRAFPDIHVRVERIVTEGEMVAAHCHVTGAHLGPGPGPGIEPTSARIDFWGMCMARVRDGQIQEGWNSFDFLSLYQQIGLVPASPP
ncbi:MAG TPA: ester cyclase [Thermoanaerobaculia bacterium]|nr:ester cyclase [Thermoanaerobaculia bacterium]